MRKPRLRRGGKVQPEDARRSARDADNRHRFRAGRDRRNRFAASAARRLPVIATAGRRDAYLACWGALYCFNGWGILPYGGARQPISAIILEKVATPPIWGWLWIAIGIIALLSALPRKRKLMVIWYTHGVFTLMASATAGWAAAAFAAFVIHNKLIGLAAGAMYTGVALSHLIVQGAVKNAVRVDDG